MRLDEEKYTESNSGSFIPILVGAVSFALLIALVMIAANGGFGTKRSAGKSTAVLEEDTANAWGDTEAGPSAVNTAETEERQNNQLDLGGSKKRAQDLDFWNMYPVEEETKETPETTVVKPKPEKTEEEEDPSKDGKHVQVTTDDGSTEWLAINNSLQKNTYELTGFQQEDHIMKYYQNGENISFAGVTLNKYAEDVDFETLKKKGISFAMIRVGSRGYESGVITADENFATYMQKATEAGLSIGVYFASQAITAEEAAEEVNYMVSQCAPYKITYPMAVKMDVIRNDSSRTETLSKNDRAGILKAYMEGITAAGYKAMVMADRNALLTKIDLAPLTGCSIWLEQPGTMPDYPYAYQIWQYGDGADIAGVGENVKLNVSMVDYAAR